MVLDDIKFYVIEEVENYYGDFKYRFISLFNGTRGIWHYKKDAAIAEGEAHERIIKTIYGLDNKKEK